MAARENLDNSINILVYKKTNHVNICHNLKKNTVVSNHSLVAAILDFLKGVVQVYFFTPKAAKVVQLVEANLMGFSELTTRVYK